MLTPEKINRLTAIFFVVVLGLLFYDAFQKQEKLEAPPPSPPEEACTGEPITVTYAYSGTVAEPHACAPQCTDGKPRYILYVNGKATQCETPPGCNDWGEDHGITCTPSVL